MEPINFKQVFNDILTQERQMREEALELFHPSSTGSCRRQIFLSKIGIKNFSDDAKGRMMSGTIIHNFIQGRLGQIGEIEFPVELKDSKFKVYFNGLCDFFDGKFVYDFKSTANISYNNKKPNDYHIPQILIYCKALNAKGASLVYIDKRNLEIRQFNIDYDAKAEQIIIETFQKCEEVYEKLKDWDGVKIPFPKCGCWGCMEEKLNKIEVPRITV